MKISQALTFELTEREARDLWLEISEAMGIIEQAVEGNTRTGLAVMGQIRDALQAVGLGAWPAAPRGTVPPIQEMTAQGLRWAHTRRETVGGGGESTEHPGPSGATGGPGPEPPPQDSSWLGMEPR